MEIRTLTNTEMQAALGTNSGKFNIAANSILVNVGYGSGTKAAPLFQLYCTQQDGVLPGSLSGGTSSPVLNVHPAYFPVATKGAECAAYVDDLSWADNNLFAGYEYFVVTSGSGRTTYFVSGILNSSQTEANDPFASTQVGSPNACCWAGDYTVGLQPFA
jgi:hypothetical protein